MTCAAVLAAEAIGSLTMWSAIPLAWLWIGARVDEATDSVAAAGGVALLGLLGTSVLAMAALTRLDRTWIALRRRAGHRQRQGALTRVVVVSATLGLIAFLLWYYVFSKAYILPFMPSQ
jgi:TM2 domain-containing membrane protein YozV